MIRKIIIYTLMAAVSIVVTGAMLMTVFFAINSKSTAAETAAADVELMNSYDAYIADTVQDAFAGAISVKKQFWIPEDAVDAPVPNPDRFGQTDDPASLQWLLDDAAELLEGQDVLFSTDIEICPGSQVKYYLDETILVISWQQVIQDVVYTVSEVKVAHTSQFRRYLANNEFDSEYLYSTTDYSDQLNEVVVSSADFYLGRQYGIVVYEGEVKRMSNGQHVDTCYIDYDGNMIFSYRGELLTKEEAQKFVDENNVSFGLCFGPILVDNGVRCEHDSYALGEVNEEYPRAALCQKDKLHYLLVTVNGAMSYTRYPNIHDFASVIDTFRVQKAYALDGGRTGTIAMQGELVNPHEYSHQRMISDVIYFASALPNHN